MSSPDDTARSLMDETLARMAEAGIVDPNRLEEAKEMLVRGMGLDELAASIERASWWGSSDIYTDAREYGGHVEELNMGLLDAERQARKVVGGAGIRSLMEDTLEDLRALKAAEEGGQEAPEQDTGKWGLLEPHAPSAEQLEELLAWCRRTLLVMDDTTDRSEIFRDLVEQYPGDAMTAMRRMTDAQVADLSAEDVAPLIASSNPKIRKDAFDELARVRGSGGEARGKTPKPERTPPTR